MRRLLPLAVFIAYAWALISVGCKGRELVDIRLYPLASDSLYEGGTVQLCAAKVYSDSTFELDPNLRQSLADSCRVEYIRRYR